MGALLGSVDEHGVCLRLKGEPLAIGEAMLTVADSNIEARGEIGEVVPGAEWQVKAEGARQVPGEAAGSGASLDKIRIKGYFYGAFFHPR